MFDTFHNVVFINGVNKTSEIEELSFVDSGKFKIRFRKSEKEYCYSYDKVAVVRDCQRINPSYKRVFHKGTIQQGITEILKFNRGGITLWHIRYENGYILRAESDDIVIKSSCIDSKRSKDTFEYFKEIASANMLGRKDDEAGILAKLYSKIEYIDKETALYPYLHSDAKQETYRGKSTLIFPFGCNASQKKAVINAFENQVSVIQGPPGTGKTQTILNIIANIILEGKNVLVVSNNNSATMNVLEKLNKYGLGFIVAPLGKKENKEVFINNQPAVPEELHQWTFSANEFQEKVAIISETESSLDKIYELRSKLAEQQKQLSTLELEWKHFQAEFCQTGHIEEQNYKRLESRQIIRVITIFKNHLEESVKRKSFLQKIRYWLASLWFRRNYTELFFNNKSIRTNPESIIFELQKSLYINRIKEIKDNINQSRQKLNEFDEKTLSNQLSRLSLDIFKKVLHDKYDNIEHQAFESVAELATMHQAVIQRYPVILSTTFSARTCLSKDVIFDYIIMDEASQVSVETGALALSVAKRAIIVGDVRQLPNVITETDRPQMEAIAKNYSIDSHYDCARNSFLESVCSAIKDAPQVLLREHYRCHPQIINFCNQRFYGGNLVIMTEDKGEQDVLEAYKTVPGNHSRNHCNQREIDVIRKEVLPSLDESEDIGIISPYNAQVNLISQQVYGIEVATVHKYQGREKDAVILSTVDDQITEFTDDANLLNVAISRAKKKLRIVTSGNEQERKGNIDELIKYIEYNNCTVTQSRIRSIFDYLYSQYTEQRIAFLQSHCKISEYDSENLTHALLCNILRQNKAFNHLGIYCHIPLRYIIKDFSILGDDEKKYARNFLTHIDFLIVNHVSKEPVLAIETDGYAFHNEGTAQHSRDILKDRIFEKYCIPFIRLSTTGSGEKELITHKLHEILNEDFAAEMKHAMKISEV